MMNHVNLVLVASVCAILMLLHPVAAQRRQEQQNDNQGNQAEVASKLPAMIHSECVAVNEAMENYTCLVPSQKQTNGNVDTSNDSDMTSCINTHPECRAWASKGECGKNPQYMLTKCRKACESCVHLHTLGGTSVPQIVTNPAYERDVLERLVQTQKHVVVEADRTVNVLTKCVNKHDMCAQWSVEGECDVNPGFMRTECAPVCFACSQVS
eukprot:CAMPEP_0119551814 /NCGR_PEP_ID=MMETSP1352-20130426/4958_1 /TAXON_ID=265584 /ORGANISM="Stauroneis constricta, Strain CCMP1120" /LENGTH=210 /DNA_ID=CAMNT_0007597929 /DNA_START=29 /DNA_END=661 /DNA_ORIENTATION=-